MTISADELSYAFNRANKRERLKAKLEEDYKNFSIRTLIDEVIRLRLEYEFYEVEKEYEE